MTNHPLTPPPELVQEWFSKALKEKPSAAELTRIIAACAAQWGADCELERCCEVLNEHNPSAYWGELLRSRRRPKPPSLKEQALWELVDAYNLGQIDDSTYDTIRKALKALPND
jgi:hypothetical protein